jgi:hypothetical protein
MMTETAGECCVSMIEIQHGFHTNLLSSRHTKVFFCNFENFRASHLLIFSNKMAELEHLPGGCLLCVNSHS